MRNTPVKTARAWRRAQGDTPVSSGRSLLLTPLLCWYWVLPAALLLFAIAGTQNTPGFIWPVVAAGVACGIAIMSVGYDGESFVAVIALIHALCYPIAAAVNLLASSPGVSEGDLWAGTPGAMWLCVVGMLGLALGSGFTRSVSRVPPLVAQCSYEERLPPQRLFLLSLSIVPLAIFRIITNTYFHSLAAAAGSFSYDNALRYGYVGYFEYVSYVAIFLQARRFCRSSTVSALKWLIATTLVPIVVMLPSGSRDAAFRGTLSSLLIVLLGSRHLPFRKSLSILASVVAGFVVLTLSVEDYRTAVTSKNRTPSSGERVDMLGTSITDSLAVIRETSDAAAQRVGRRLADYVVPGQIVQTFPSVMHFKGLDGLAGMPWLVLPNGLRPKGSEYDAQYTAALSLEVGVSTGGSSPAMILGDLYSRFSWAGVFIGMALIGALICSLDAWLHSHRESVPSAILHGLLILPFVRLSYESIQGVFIVFTRHLIISVVLALILQRLLLMHGHRMRGPRVLRSGPDLGAAWVRLGSGQGK